MIKQVDGRWVLYTEGGMKIGTFSSRAQARKREKEIAAFKDKKK